MAGRLPKYESPLWLLLLEERLKRLRENQCLGHDVGRGAECLSCDICPGLDTHYWRKTCKNCKCRSEEHNLQADVEKFEVLLYNPTKQSQVNEGEGQPTLGYFKPNEPKILCIVNPDGKSPPKMIQFDWVPPNISNSMIVEFLNQFDSNSLPITGSSGAVRRRTQLKVQIPCDDYNLKLRVELDTKDQSKYDSFLNSARTAFGQGRVIRFCVGGLSLARRVPRDIDVSVAKRDIPKLLQQSTPKGEKHWVDEQWKKNLSKKEVFELLEVKERGQSMSQALQRVDRAVGEEPEEPLEDYNPHYEYRVFLQRVHGINNCSMNVDSAGDPLDLIKCDLNSNLAEDAVIYNEVKTCHECKSVIRHKSLAVATQNNHAGLALIWHPQCFVCHLCGVLLVDQYYFFSGDMIYCGRHFALYSAEWNRCGGCDQLILRGPYTFAEDKCFHLEHFCCTVCDSVLAGREYIMESGNPYCMKCYSREFCKTCRMCHEVIAMNESGIHVNHLGDNGHWHATPRCFKCEFCSESLVNKLFKLHDDMPFCNGQCINGYIQSGMPR